MLLLVFVIFFSSPLSLITIIMFGKAIHPIVISLEVLFFLSVPILSALIWYIFLLFFSLLFSPPTTIFSSPRLSVIEFVKIWMKEKPLHLKRNC